MFLRFNTKEASFVKDLSQTLSKSDHKYRSYKEKCKICQVLSERIYMKKIQSKNKIKLSEIYFNTNSFRKNLIYFTFFLITSIFMV